MVQVAKLVRKKLGELLVEEGLVREEQVQEALKKQQATGELLGETLVKLNYVSEIDIARTIARQFGLPYIDATKYNVPKDVLDVIPGDLMYAHQFIILDKIGKALVLAVSGVIRQDVFEELERKSGPLFIFVSTASQVLAALRKQIPQPAGAKG